MTVGRSVTTPAATHSTMGGQGVNEHTKRALILGAGAAAGGWGGAMVLARVGAAYGLRLGPMGTLAGAAVGAMLGVGLARMLAPDTQDIAGELEMEVDKEAA